MPIRRVLLALSCIALLLPAERAQAATFTFDSLADSTPTPLALTDSGVTATFTSPDVSDFFVFPASFTALMSGKVLVAGGDIPTDSLAVAFSAPQSVLSVQFALNTPNAATPFSLTAYLGAAQVGTSSATGTIFSFSEGTLNYSGAAFDRVVLTSAAQDFAIDNLTVRQAAVPEPAVMTLLVGAIVGLTARRRVRA